MRTAFTGVGTALITPFIKGGALTAATWLAGKRGWFSLRDML